MKAETHLRVNATYESHKNYNNSKITQKYVESFICVA